MSHNHIMQHFKIEKSYNVYTLALFFGTLYN